MFLFTSKPGSVTNASSFTKVLPKFDQTFQDNEQIFMQLIYTSLIHIFIWQNKDFISYTLSNQDSIIKLL